MEQEYYIGLDIGTSSVGWAVTDMNYQIIKRHGKALWGSRLFASANTAEERRGFRTARRRLDRRNWRINILQELFAEEISKVDSGFYLRMKESKYYPEDKKDSSGKCPELPYALFVDKDYTDKDYHKEYPTIYHLRKMLMETEKVPDIRLVYLAIHHMMKHRGHFLLSGDINQVTEFENTFLQFAENLKNEELDFQVEMSEERIKEVEIVLKDKNLTKSAKKNRLIKYFGAKSACEKAVFTLITGGTVKLSDVLGNEELNNCEKDKISFSDNNYDEYVGTVEEDLGEQFYIIESAKAVYDWSILADILGDSASISEAKVKSYEKHKEDLAYLKKVVKQYLPKEIYKKVFVITEDKLCNYPAYIGMTKINGKKVDLQGKQCSREDFLSFLKKEVVKKIEDESVKNYLSEEIEKDTFLPRQVNKDNGVIPYQIHKFELKKIIDNLSDKMPFIKENGEKIMQLFEFRIPYYVGPLGKKSEKFAWAVRKNDDKIYPWNFEQVIDVEESAEKFIRRMTNKCTYLIGEDVLPKDSLLYSKYIVLNELNNLRLGGEKISVALKQRIYEELFQRKRKVRQKDLKNYLIREGIAGKEVEISGIDGDFKGSLTAYHDFKEKLTGVELSKKEQEEIILNIVLFGDDKKLLKQRLGKRFPKLTEKQKATLASLSYSGWGRFSKKFLEEITAPAPETGEVWNIITALWESNNNLMQLLSSDYMFMESIEEFNHGKKNMTLTYETIENLYVSSELVSYYGSHDTSNKVRKQIAWKQNTKEAVWTEIVTEKIRKQKEILEILGKEESEILSSYIKEITWNDGTNREGHAAKVYFNALFGLDFTRTEDNYINAGLNYGYSIILSAFTREIVANGYITQLGLFHDNMFNQFNLASDLMEPFRVLIDQKVLQMKLIDFEHSEKMQLVDILNQEVLIDGKNQYVNNAIKIYCKSVFDALNDDDSSLMRFYRIEL